ncbi:hypothetical protein [Paracoccus jeotgali]|uniref:hypothetical protein n=1 Tax=Paracoccus jeotgali TaxID=2065379 RepID=UPI00131589BD|nr:hypothetical protein [Paracoccus jeotgali]
MKRHRSHERWGSCETYSSLADLAEAALDVDTLFALKDGELPIDCMFKKGQGEVLFVFFNAALSPSANHVLPVFSWMKTASVLSGSKLFISDPTLFLSDEILLGWYLGSGTYPTQGVLEAIIRIVQKRSGAKKLAFVGSSGGGFAALYFASRFSEAIAYVNAPATNLIAHHNPKSIRVFSKFALGGGNIADFPGVVNLTEKAPAAGAKMYITQNRGDQTYISRHVAPYLASLGIPWHGKSLDTKGVSVFVGDWGIGHVMPPPEVVKEILSAIDLSSVPRVST